jgi:hypothetical protein
MSRRRIFLCLQRFCLGTGHLSVPSSSQPEEASLETWGGLRGKDDAVSTEVWDACCSVVNDWGWRPWQVKHCSTLSVLPHLPSWTCIRDETHVETKPHFYQKRNAISRNIRGEVGENLADCLAETKKELALGHTGVDRVPCCKGVWVFLLRGLGIQQALADRQLTISQPKLTVYLLQGGVLASKSERLYFGWEWIKNRRRVIVFLDLSHNRNTIWLPILLVCTIFEVLDKPLELRSVAHEEERTIFASVLDRSTLRLKIGPTCNCLENPKTPHHPVLGLTSGPHAC